MPSCRNAELSVPRHSVKVRLHHYEKQENAFERTAKDVYALASYHGSAPGRDEHLDLCDRQAGGAHHVCFYPYLSGDSRRAVLL